MEASARQDGEPVLWWVLPIAVLMAVPLGYVRYQAFANAIPPYFRASATRAPLPAGLMLLSALGVGTLAVLGFAGGGEGSDAMGLASGMLALTFASAGVGYLVTRQPFAAGLRVATVVGFVAMVAALILWTAGGEGWAGYLETLMELEYTRHPWFWPGLALMVGAIAAAYFLFRRFAPPERQQLGIVYLIAIPPCVVAYFIGFAAGGAVRHV